MVQVDIFWSYGIGAGLAVAAHRQIAREATKPGSIWEQVTQSPYFSKTLLFLSLIFVPSGFWLLWQFSSWETMHAGSRDLPVWLVALFAVSNVSQGALAFAICYHLIKQNRLYAAWLNFVLAYVGFFFILIHGWDAKGYQRFFSPDRTAFENWTWRTAMDWFHSDVALTLYGMGVILIPALLGMTASWLGKGLRRDEQFSWPRLTGMLGFLASVFVLALGLALVSSLALMNLGYAGGLMISAVLFVLVLKPRTGLGLRICRLMTLTDVGSGDVRHEPMLSMSR